MSKKNNTKTTEEVIVDEFADVYPKNLEFEGSKVMRYKKVKLNGHELYEVFTFDGLSKHINSLEELKEIKKK